MECRKDEGVLDEIPGAYKDIDAVMAAQADLVEVVHTLQAGDVRQRLILASQQTAPPFTGGASYCRRRGVGAT